MQERYLEMISVKDQMIMNLVETQRIENQKNMEKLHNTLESKDRQIENCAAQFMDFLKGFMTRQNYHFD